MKWCTFDYRKEQNNKVIIIIKLKKKKGKKGGAWISHRDEMMMISKLKLYSPWQFLKE